MPRSGWLAVGTLAGALVDAGGFGQAGWLAIALVLGIAGTRARWLPGGAARLPGRAVAGAAVGAAVIALRVAVLGAVGGGSDGVAASSLPTGDGPWIARVATIGSPRDGHQTATLQLGVPGSSLLVATRLPRYPEIEPGGEVRVRGALRAPPSDDYGRFLARSGVIATLEARSLELVGDGDRPGPTLEELRRSGGDALIRALPEPEAGLAAGILIGLRDRVDRDLAAAFTTAGVSHVIAISGWNIAIVAGTVAALLRRWPRRRRAIATVAVIALYTIFAGASASVLRAALMAGVVLLARETGRAGRASAGLGWTVASLLVVEPAFATDAGFALSAAATAGLLVWATPATEWLRRVGGGRLPGWLCASLGVSLAAQAATLPIVLLAFGRLAILAPGVNLVVVPLVAPAMATGIVALGAGWLTLLGAPSALATVAGLPAWLALAAMDRIVAAAASLPFASVTLGPPVNTVAAVLSGAVILALATGRRLPGPTRRQLRGASAVTEPATQPATRVAATASGAQSRRATRRLTPPQRIAAGGLALVVLGAVLVAANRPDGRVRVTVLDVGQGDAILVEGNRGSRMLVDGGPDPDRLLVALDTRIPPWDRRIDLLVLTHPHEDHVGGMALLMARYRIGRLMEPGMLGPGPGYRAWTARLAATGRHPDRLTTGARLSVDDVAFRVLWPDADAVPFEPPDGGTAINNVSIVLLGAFGRERFLLAGDIEEGIDPILLARGMPRVDLLKVAHHGSRTSSTDAFLAAIRPAVAIVSVGAKNRYGHPSPATVGRLRARRAEVFRTDLDGSVEVTLDGTQLAAHAEGGDQPRPDPSQGTGTPRADGAPNAPRIGPPLAGGCLIAGLGRGPADPRERPSTPSPSTAAAPTALLYHRSDDGPWAGRCRLAPPVSRSPDVVRAARAGRRRGRGLAGEPDRASRSRGGPAARRGRGATSRRGQGPPRRRSGTRSRTR